MARLSHARLAIAIATAAAFGLAACGGGSEEPAPADTPSETATPSPTPAPEPPAPAAEPAPAPEPVAAGGGDVAAGAELYATYCASCHGSGGAGDGPVAAGLNPKPAKHNDATYMNTLSDEHIFRVIKEGGPAVGKSPLMAPWGGTLSDAQIRDLVAFVRSLSR